MKSMFVGTQCETIAQNTNNNHNTGFKILRNV